MAWQDGLMSRRAYISNIQRFCVHDGKGLRTTVFFQGCPLGCRWCQNPETISPNPQIMMNGSICSGCKSCVDACNNRAVTLGNEGLPVTNFDECILCLDCVKECFFKARSVSGELYSVDELYAEIIKDKEFYLQSDGGVTLSGGEPLLRPDYCKDLLSKCGGFNRAIETCGYVEWSAFEKVIPVTDVFLYDYKIHDEKEHIKWTGVSNKRILHNLKRLIGDQTPKDIIIRIPLVPGVNDSDEIFTVMMNFISGEGAIHEIHILPFHHLGSSKYALINKPYSMDGWREENDERIMACKDIAVSKGFRVSVGGGGF